MSLDPTGDLISEIREIPAVSAIVGARVRAREPHGATASYAGDARPPGKFVAFIVISTLSRPPERRVPVTFAEYRLRCYGRTGEEADALFDAVAGGLHRRGHRLRPGGLGIYASYVSGGEQDSDPKTSQPVTAGSIQLIATTQVVV